MPMKNELRILILADDDSLAKMVEFELRKADLLFTSRTVNSKKTLANKLALFLPDIVLSEYELAGFEGLSALEFVKKYYPDLPFVIISEAIGEEKAIEVFKKGVTDFVLKHRLSQLAGVIQRALHEAVKGKVLKKIQEERTLFLFELGKRVTELTVVNQISRILQNQNNSPSELFKQIVSIMPMAWQYPDITAARIIFKDEEFKTLNFMESPWQQSCRFFVNSIPGMVDIFYLEEMPNEFEGPFLSGERTLLNMIAELLKFFLERRYANEALKHNEALFRTVLETLPVGVWMIKPDGNIVLENSACRNIIGGGRCDHAYQFQEKLGWWMDTGQRITPDEWPVSRVFKNGSSRLNKISRIRCLDGCCKTIVSSAVPIRNEKNEIVAAIEVNEDVTEQKRAETALKESEKKYSTLVESSLTGIYINQNGRIVFLNNRFAEIYGYRREELIGIESWKLVYPDDRAFVDEMRERRLSGEGVPAEYEARGLKKDEQVIWVVRTHCVIDYNGKLSILGNLVDITHRKQMEQDLQRSHKELRYLSAQLLRAQEDERKKIARDLHDTIAQNLLAIKIFLEDKAIQLHNRRIPIDITLDDLIDMANCSIQELRRIMADLRPSILDDLGLMAAVHWHCVEFHKTYPLIRLEKQFDLREQQIPDSLKVVMYRIFQEAMNNVAKHSAADTVRLILREYRGRIEIIVEDNGVGFDARRQISQPGESKKFGLLGLKERSELSNGSFQIRSRKGKGTLLKVAWQL